MKKTIYLILALILFVDCGRKTENAIEDNAEIIEIPDQIVNNIHDIVENYRYVTLDVDDNIDAALGAVSKLRVFRDKIYVMDNVFTNKVLIFDIDGAFLKKVGQIGRGPLEYIDLATFEVDYVKEELLIHDGLGGKTLVFDLDGNYKRTIANHEMRVEGLAVLSNGYIVNGISAHYWSVKEAGNYKLIICDQNGNILKKEIEDELSFPWSYASKNFLNPNFDGTATFAPQFMNDVYRVSEQGDIEQIYEIEFHDMLDRNEFTKYDSPMDFNRSSESHDTTFIGNHADSDDYFYFTYEYGKRPYCVYYHKKSKRSLVCDDRLCGKNLTFDEHGNFWGSVAEASIFSEDSAKAAEIRNAIEESGNPVVVCYNLK